MWISTNSTPEFNPTNVKREFPEPGMVIKRNGTELQIMEPASKKERQKPEVKLL